MPEPEMPVEQSPHTNTKHAALTGYLQYSWSLIRREGLVYFIKRSYGLGSWKIREFFRSLSVNRGVSSQDRILEIADLDRKGIHLAPSTSHSESGQVEAASLSQIPSMCDQLVQLATTSHAQHLIEREALILEGRQLFSGQKVLFVSPIRVLGGGANLVFLVARAMRQMGVDAQLLNLNVHRGWFETHYPQPGMPVFFTDVEHIPQASRVYDAVIATSNPTVSWIAPLADQQPAPSIGYYIQDYEPYFYAQGSHEFQKAADSYSLIPNVVRMVTTPWIAEQIQRHHHLDSVIVGGHMDTDLFQPQTCSGPALPERPLRITAMIRPATPRRNPQLTMAVLRQISQRYSAKVEFLLFGCELNDPGFAALEQDFPWKLAGQLRSSQVASLFNQADIFVDFSEFQAFGLTSLEAMAMGLAVIVPANGGTGIYARHAENCLVVDGHDQQACVASLARLVEDDSLRRKLQTNAISTAARFYPELPALKILKLLFKDRS